MFRRIVTVLSLVALTASITATVPSPSLAVDLAGTTITATLDGKPIDPTQAGRYYCHDFEYPVIRCYASAARLESAVSSGDGGRAALASDVRYMTVYDYASFAGAYAHLSQDYEGLWAIGWNDKISSFRVQNSQSGKLYTDWYASGAVLNFCCNSQVTSLSSTFNNNISSVYRS
jgi:hypothetical protein